MADAVAIQHEPQHHAVPDGHDLANHNSANQGPSNHKPDSHVPTNQREDDGNDLSNQSEDNYDQAIDVYGDYDYGTGDAMESVSDRRVDGSDNVINDSFDVIGPQLPDEFTTVNNPFIVHTEGNRDSSTQVNIVIELLSRCLVHGWLGYSVSFAGYPDKRLDELCELRISKLFLVSFQCVQNKYKIATRNVGRFGCIIYNTCCYFF